MIWLLPVLLAGQDSTLPIAIFSGWGHAGDQCAGNNHDLAGNSLCCDGQPDHLSQQQDTPPRVEQTAQVTR